MPSKNTLERWRKLKEEYESVFGREFQDFTDADHPYPDLGRVGVQGMSAAHAHFTARNRAGETASQRRSRERREKNSQNRQRARAHIQGKDARLVSTTGKLLARIAAGCKKAFLPAGDGFPAGCAAHAQGKCPWFHPGEPEYEAACAGRLAGPTKEGRNFNAAKRAALSAAQNSTRGKGSRQGRSGARSGKNTRKAGRGGPPS